MAKRNEMHIQSATINPNESMKTGFDLESSQWGVEQNIDQYKEHAQKERDRQSYFGRSKGGYRKMATIPDIVAIKILQDHKLDLHDKDFMTNPANLTKLKKILMTEYRDLVINS